MSYYRESFSRKEKGQRIDNIPDTGTQTGKYFNDAYGTWYEVKADKGHLYWMIGDYKTQPKQRRQIT